MSTTTPAVWLALLAAALFGASTSVRQAGG
jgi:hypothetical protein